LQKFIERQNKFQTNKESRIQEIEKNLYEEKYDFVPKINKIIKCKSQKNIMDKNKNDYKIIKHLMDSQFDELKE
jgi:hypothetical protein